MMKESVNCEKGTMKRRQRKCEEQEQKENYDRGMKKVLRVEMKI